MAGNDLGWRNSAACKGVDPDKFFDIAWHTPEDRQVIHNLCRSCSVISECRAYGEHIREHNVVYGGVYFRGTKTSTILGVRQKQKKEVKI